MYAVSCVLCVCCVAFSPAGLSPPPHPPLYWVFFAPAKQKYAADGFVLVGIYESSFVPRLTVLIHPGVVATKVRYFGGSNRLKCPRGQMGTKPAKVGRLAPCLLNQGGFEPG